MRMAQKVLLFWVGWVLAVTSIFFIEALVIIGVRGGPTVTFWCAVVSGFVGLALIINCSNAANLASGWRNITGLKLKYFPEVVEEGKPPHLYVELLLREKAKVASSWAETRDRQKTKLEHLKDRGNKQVYLEELVPVVYTSYTEADQVSINMVCKEAELIQERTTICFNEYHKAWDFFKELGMLPINPETSQPWPDPNSFRLYVCRAQEENRN